MPEVVSMVSAHIAPERFAEVVERFGAAVRGECPNADTHHCFGARAA